MHSFHSDIEDLLIPDSTDSEAFEPAKIHRRPAEELWWRVLVESLSDIGIVPHDRPRRFVNIDEYYESRDFLMAPYVDTEHEELKSIHWILEQLQLDFVKFQDRLALVQCALCGVTFVCEQCMCNMIDGPGVDYDEE